MARRTKLKWQTLVSLFAVFVIAGMGVAYTLWYDDVHIEGTVQTGNVDVVLTGPYLIKFVQELDENERPTGNCYFYKGYGKAADDSLGAVPEDASGGVHGDLPCKNWIPIPENKKTATCDARINEGRDLLNVRVTGAYPSFHCIVIFDVDNIGSVPVHLTMMDHNGNTIASDTVQNEGGHGQVANFLGCYPRTYQIDPNKRIFCAIKIHFTNDTPGIDQNSEYKFGFWATAKQWNESGLPPVPNGGLPLGN